MNSYILLALGWLKDNVKHLGFPLAVLFCGLWLRGCGALAECQDKLAVPPVKVEAAQGATQTAKAKQIVKLVPQYIYVPGEAPKPLPCPSIEIESEASAEQVHWQSASIGPVLAPSASQVQSNALFLGIGYLESPYLELGYGYKSFRINGKLNTDIKPGFGFTYDWLTW